jgi:uncharacterized protein (TIGR02284 family)
METNEKVNDLLNQLVQINNDRVEGYEKAAKETEDVDLKGLFTSMASKSRLLKSELASEIINRGGTVTESTTTSGKVFRAWMDFKAALTGKDRHAILSSCEFGEDTAQATYKTVLDSGKDLPPNLLKLIAGQKEKLHEDHNRVKELRDSVLHHNHH